MVRDGRSGRGRQMMGLAQAAQESTDRVIKMVHDDEGSLKLAAQEDPDETE
jgi:hypothetical protein